MLGVAADGTSLQFGVQQALFISGSGTCVPSPSNCQTIDMQPGQVETLQYDSPTDGLVQYELAVVSVNGIVAASYALGARAPSAGELQRPHAARTDGADRRRPRHSNRI